MPIRFKSAKTRPPNDVQAKRRYALWLAVFGIVLVLPVALLLLRVHQQLRHEVFFQYQSASVELLNRVNERVYEILKPESERPFDQYSFWSVPQNALVPEQTLNVSPLAQMAQQTSVPGVIGYFQIDPDGSFHSPVVPEIELNGLGSAKAKTFSQSDLEQRRTLKARLKVLVDKDAASIAAEEGQPAPSSRDFADAASPSSALAPESEADALASKDQSAPIGQKNKQEALAKRTEPRGKTIDELKFNEALYRRQQTLPERADEGWVLRSRKEAYRSLSQAPRKETLSYLDERKRDLRSNTAQPQAPTSAIDTKASDGKQAKRGLTENNVDHANEPAVRLAGKVEQFEGEIYPIEFEILPSGDFSFFRKVWRDRQRYIQGFVAKRSEFLHQVFESAYQGSALRERVTLTVSHRGQVLKSYGMEPQPGAILIFRSPLAFPLSDVELLISATGLPLGAGARLVNAIAIFLGLLIPSALYGLYRLGAGQIDLAQQRSNFVSAVSHELRTPLTSIRMYGEILRSGWVESEEKKRSYYDYIFFESERLSRLISNVLQLARLTNNDAPLELAPHSPDRLLDLIHSTVNSQIEAAGFTLEIAKDTASKNLTILADEDAFSRIFINLVDNALKFSRDASKKQILIGYRLAGNGAQSGGEVIFFVRDFGPGIDKTRRRKLFQLFYRGEDELTRTTPGTGIGLALVKELATKLKAHVDLENKNPGVEFTVCFKFSLA